MNNNETPTTRDNVIDRIFSGEPLTEWLDESDGPTDTMTDAQADREFAQEADWAAAREFG